MNLWHILTTAGNWNAETSLQLVSKLLRTLARTEDATAYPSTACIHLLCVLGQQLAPSILAKHSRGKAAAVNDAKLPGAVPLLSAFFRPLKKKPQGDAAVQWCDYRPT